MKTAEERFDVINPATGEKVGDHIQMGPGDVDRAVADAREAFAAWSRSPFQRRREILLDAAAILSRRASQVGEIISAETGKSRLDAVVAEIFPTCDLLHYYGKNAEKFLRPVKTGGTLVLPGRACRYLFEPRGVVGIIAPWNYPFSLASGPVISALAAGNAAVLKPSSQTTASGLILREVLREAGLPDKVLQVVTGSGAVTGRALIDHPGLDMLFFTGSTGVGLEVNAAAARRLIPAVMELGGKDAMIVTRNADVGRAAHAAVWGAFFNSGQTCIGVEFCFAEAAVYPALLERVLDIARGLESGTRSGQVGSMTMESQVRIVEEQLRDAVAKGAQIRLGGARRPSDKGLFFAPTVITGITPEMKIWKEETFGPVLPVVSYDKPEDAVRMANSTEFGLSASVFSRDMAEANWFAERLHTGSVNINDCLVTFAVPSLPFGGAKHSGVGTYHGRSGLRNFCRIKSVTEYGGSAAKEFFHYPVARGIQEAMEAVLALRFTRSAGERWKALPRLSGLAADLLKGAARKRAGGRAAR